MHRRAIAVSGIVQGVGFRPFVYDLATPVRSQWLRQKPDRRRADRGGRRTSVPRSIPGRADVKSAAAGPDRRRPVRRPESPPAILGFRIEASDADRASPIFISPDVATCDDCLRELFDPRRSALSLSVSQLHQLRSAADDHPRSALRPRAHDAWPAFAMCPACRAEYDDPQQSPVPCPADRLPCVWSAVAGARRPRSTDRERTIRLRLGSRAAQAREDRRAQGPGRLPSRLHGRRSTRRWPSLRRRKHRDREAAGGHGARRRGGPGAVRADPGRGSTARRRRAGRSFCCAGGRARRSPTWSRPGTRLWA